MLNDAKIQKAFVVELIGSFLFNLIFFIGGYFLAPGLQEYIANNLYTVGYGFAIFHFAFPFFLSSTIYLLIVRNKTVDVLDVDIPKWTIWFVVIGFVSIFMLVVVLDFMK